ncbi:hypothetical protein RJ640_006427 [Escallonia rubra]|uniref:Autophagy-related protein 16 domain-containing protein n=1 Tax=Escallonia rubra TaxID=112253 RepID=A0AA88SAR7_9ASTE|nr:hypothetical protein RJ640_006427 [Escallonia rubra]
MHKSVCSLATGGAGLLVSEPGEYKLPQPPSKADDTSTSGGDWQKEKVLIRRGSRKGSEWKEKAENLELELQQCYKAQARLSEQLVVEVAESRASKALAVEKEAGLTKTQNELTQARDECSCLAALLEENTKGLDLLISENKDLKAQLEEMKQRANSAEAENRMLVDRWMLQKMQDAERLNEVV